MNKEFVVKMMQAKQLEYQAMKEIMPEKLVNRIEKLEGEFVSLAKECFLTVLSESSAEKKTKEASTEGRTRKVTIE